MRDATASPLTGASPCVTHSAPCDAVGGCYGEAERVYRDDLECHPENGWSLFGLVRSLEFQGKADEARRVRARFEKASADADVKLSSSCFCQPGV